MSAVETDLIDTENERVERWRVGELERAGYGPEQAFELAMCHEVDLHLAIDLVRQGCPPDLALKILI